MPPLPTSKFFVRVGSLLFFLSSSLILAFAPSSRHQTRPRVIRQKLLLKNHHQPSRYFHGPSLLWVKPGEEAPGSGGEPSEEDGGEELTLKDDDWRAFRAKLVMGEKKGHSTASSAATTTSDDRSSSSSMTDPSTPSTADDDDWGDLDGIGSLFRGAFVEKTSTSKSPAVSPNADTSSSAAKTSSRNGGGDQSLADSTMTPLDPSQWAYDSGDVIEQGAVILGGVEQEFGFGLRQQYFHKAAILVLDHSSTFTKGILLNRPTDLTLEDDINPGTQWRVWFGGDVEGLKEKHPDIVCIHSLKNEKATKASIPVMKDIQWTTFANAKKLVKAGVASVSDFWCFVGYAGWGPGQLKGELDRSSWLMVATDSGTLLKELARQSEGADPRDAGLDTWTLLMQMIGRSETAKQYSGDFDDMMLKEWARKNLLSEAAGGGAGRQLRDPEEFNDNPELVEELLSRIESRSDPPLEGALVRASGADRSPFLLENQEFHKSVVLILKDEEAATVGVVLNRPSGQGVGIKVESVGSSGSTKTVNIPMRFGGPYNVQGEEPLLWLHCNAALREAKIGNPVGAHRSNGIYKCTANDVMKAVASGLADPYEFVCVSGVSVWPKVKEGTAQGMEGALELGDFELVPTASVDNVWTMLKKEHNILTRSTLRVNLALSEETWTVAKGAGDQETMNRRKITPLEPIKGLGENFDEEDDSMVFKSGYEVRRLSDDALRGWCATFLLGVHDYKRS